VSLRDIALQAKVTFQTVSAVLTNKEGARVSTAKREEIRAIATALGYRPNVSARAMLAGRFDTVMLVQTWRGHPLEYLLAGLLDGCQHHGQRLLIERLDDATLADETLMSRMLTEHGADGLLVNCVVDLPSGLPEVLHRHRLPTVWLNWNAPRDCVRPDDFGGAQQITRRLLELGHRKIAWAPVHTSNHHSEVERFAGHSEALRQVGLQPQRLTPRSAPWMDGVEWDALSRTWAKDAQRPSALICSGLGDAQCARLSLQRAGLRVPADVSLTTFAPEPAEHGGHPISTVLIPDRAMGVAGVDMLLRRIAKPSCSEKSHLIPCGYAEGGTLAPPP